MLHGAHGIAALPGNELVQPAERTVMRIFNAILSRWVI
jgi:hypothetical protein